jgi:flagellar basal-body rod protein FlgB
MTDGIEAITTAALGLALDAASLRQQAIAANIANAGSADYAPVTVSFDAQLEDARRALESPGRLDATSLAGVQPRLEAVPFDATGEPPEVSLDVEMANLARNSVQYQALLKALSRHYAMLSAAVSEGKR